MGFYVVEALLQFQQNTFYNYKVILVVLILERDLILLTWECGQLPNFSVLSYILNI